MDSNFLTPIEKQYLYDYSTVKEFNELIINNKENEKYVELFNKKNLEEKYKIIYTLILNIFKGKEYILIDFIIHLLNNKHIVLSDDFIIDNSENIPTKIPIYVEDKSNFIIPNNLLHLQSETNSLIKCLTKTIKYDINDENDIKKFFKDLKEIKYLFIKFIKLLTICYDQLKNKHNKNFLPDHLLNNLKFFTENFSTYEKKFVDNDKNNNIENEIIKIKSELKNKQELLKNICKTIKTDVRPLIKPLISNVNKSLLAFLRYNYDNKNISNTSVVMLSPNKKKYLFQIVIKKTFDKNSFENYVKTISLNRPIGKHKQDEYPINVVLGRKIKMDLILSSFFVEENRRKRRKEEKE
ncbi:hypothetical protein PIROE2DRAFT_59154 [Piromyces sp. E2]|nr:hypothetical protein PIROE2DRAFT_59154 [Piromyces sp. E2]|eukprot:OUM66805.1 hypothetical protein PIROE2DRAFT_59154 [Piromyces sp. E2]